MLGFMPEISTTDNHKTGDQGRKENSRFGTDQCCDRANEQEHTCRRLILNKLHKRCDNTFYLRL